MSDATYWKPIIHTEYEALCARPGYKRTPLMVEAVDGGWVSVADYMALKLKLDEFAAQPPCGADGAELAALVIRDLCESEPENPDDPDTLCVKVDYVREVIRQHASQPAAPVAPATVVPEADPFGVDADLCGELHELDTELGYRAASRIGQLAMLAASKREGGVT